MEPRGARTAPYAQGRHRFRADRGQDHVRPHRRVGLGLHRQLPHRSAAEAAGRGGGAGGKRRAGGRRDRRGARAAGRAGPGNRGRTRRAGVPGRAGHRRRARRGAGWQAEAHPHPEGDDDHRRRWRETEARNPRPDHHRREGHHTEDTACTRGEEEGIGMLLPARVKFRKVHRGRRTGVATQGNDLAFGEFGLQASEAAWMSNRQIEAARRVMTRFVRRGGQVFIRVFPDKSVTKKPAETRMGSGKGAPEGWVAVIKPGRVLFEMGGVTPEMAKRAFQLAAYKLPIRTRTVGIKSGVKAAADVKIKGAAAAGEAGALPGALPLGAPAAAAPAAAPARGLKAAPGAAPAAVKAAPGAAPAAAKAPAAASRPAGKGKK